MSKKSARKGKPEYTPLSQHAHKGNTLQAPLRQLLLQHVDWTRDRLPECLWIAALALDYGLDEFIDRYLHFLEQLDEYWREDEIVALALVSDFALVPEELRKPFVDQHQDLIEEMFCRPAGAILALFPGNPAAWLLDMMGSAFDAATRESTIEKLRTIVRLLLDADGPFATRVRIVPLNRLLAHNRISFSQNLPVVDLLPRYPNGLSADDREHVEGTIRAIMGTVLQSRVDLEPLSWPRHFWQHNIELASCQPLEMKYKQEESQDARWAESILESASANAGTARAYLEQVSKEFRPDLFDPTRDEILVGLFARITRLYAMLVDEPRFWTRDLGGIILRCLADSAITFIYLVEKGNDEDYRRFKEYGEGQQKLLALHLQDNYMDAKSIDGLSAGEIARRLDLFPELLNIELKGWTSKNARELAQAVGMQEIYRLIYSPASNDLHGSWFSLKGSNLSYCVEPLHRYHRLPMHGHPPIFPDIINVATKVYAAALDVASAKVSYPEMADKLKRVPTAPDEERLGDTS